MRQTSHHVILVWWRSDHRDGTWVLRNTAWYQWWKHSQIAAGMVLRQGQPSRNLYQTRSYDHFGPFAASYVNSSTLLIFIYNEQFIGQAWWRLEMGSPHRNWKRDFNRWRRRSSNKHMSVNDRNMSPYSPNPLPGSASS